MQIDCPGQEYSIREKVYTVKGKLDYSKLATFLLKTKKNFI